MCGDREYFSISLVYHVFSPEDEFFTYSYILRKKGLIIIGGGKDLDDVKEHLSFGGYRYVIRSINGCILILVRRAKDFNITIFHTTQDLERIPEIVEGSAHGALVVGLDLKEELTEILRTQILGLK